MRRQVFKRAILNVLAYCIANQFGRPYFSSIKSPPLVRLNGTKLYQLYVCFRERIVTVVRNCSRKGIV